MKKIALIIDDDPRVREMLEDRIHSLGMDCDSAGCQSSAAAFLQKGRYDLILLDQELPIRKGKPTQKQVGRNLLDQIRKDSRNENAPVIIVTGHDGENSSVVSDLLFNGATYFIHKPQLGILEEKIKAIFDRQQQQSKKNQQAETAPPLKPFTGGKLEFRSDGIYLNDVRIASAGTNIARILRELVKRTESGKRRALSCKQLADALGFERGDKAVAEAISPFRRGVIELLRESGFAADTDTVIARRRGGGYELANTIETDQSGTASEETGNKEPTPEERQAWFIAQARAGNKPSKAIYKKQFGASESTWKRDLKGIANLLELVGVGANAYYQSRKLPSGIAPQTCLPGVSSCKPIQTD